jgi:hypothetical protein
VISTYLEPACEENIKGLGSSEIAFIFGNIEDCYDIACALLQKLEVIINFHALLRAEI